MVRSTVMFALFLLSAYPLAADALEVPGNQTVGICLLVEMTSSEQVIELVESTELTIVVQCSKQQDVIRLRRELDTKRVLGSRVYVSQIEDGRLCLADNLADVVFSASNLVVTREELIRVLRPRGRLVEEERVTIKPVPEGTGDWTPSLPGRRE